MPVCEFCHKTQTQIGFVNFQEVVLQLDTRASIDRVQILGHESRVPSSIEVQIGDVPGGGLTPGSSNEVPDVKAAKFVSLGVIRMQSPGNNRCANIM